MTSTPTLRSKCYFIPMLRYIHTTVRTYLKPFDLDIKSSWERHVYKKKKIPPSLSPPLPPPLPPRQGMSVSVSTCRNKGTVLIQTFVVFTGRGWTWTTSVSLLSSSKLPSNFSHSQPGGTWWGNLKSWNCPEIWGREKSIIWRTKCFEKVISLWKCYQKNKK
jgi:hypothetical protein